MTAPVVIAPPGWPAWPERTTVLCQGEHTEDPDKFCCVAAWTAEWLEQPDGPDAGEPWRFTRQQLRILAYWFAFDARLRWVHRRGTVRMCKGWGKDPFGAVVSAVELCGPCRVGPDGRGATHPAPWVQIAAVSREQTRTTMRLFPSLFSDRAKERFRLDINREIIYAAGARGVIEAVTSSPDSLEGGRATLVIRNETQKWRSTNAGHEMAEVIDGNLTKSRDGAARALSLCNAHVPGEDTVGEREWDAYQAIATGRTRLQDVLYVAVEAPPDTRLDDAESLKAGLRAARGDSIWLDEERHVAEIWDPKTTPSEGRRKYLNQVVAAEDAWVQPYEWDACRVEPRPELVEGEEITLGFDGSKSDDHSALIATRVSDGCTFTLGVWDPDRFGGEAPRFEIDAKVLWAKDTYDVVGFYSDLHPWESYVDRWRDEFGDDLVVNATEKHPIAWDMRARQAAFTKAAERFFDAIVEGALPHDGNAALAEHVKNARRRPNRWGVSFGKEHRESSRKVDALAAAVLSRLAYWDFMALPESKRRRRKRTGKAMFG